MTRGHLVAITIDNQRFVPAIQDTKTGEIFSMQFGEEIHGEIYERIAKNMGIYEASPDWYDIYNIMRALGFKEGYVKAGTSEFTSRVEMERLFGLGESRRLYYKGIVELPNEHGPNKFYD
jgi:hypothetical protein